MKKIFLLFVVSLFIKFLYAQAPSSCVVPDNLYNAYIFDVKDLAIKHMYQIHSPDTNSIIIQQSSIDSIMGGLASIFNATSLPGRDSVFDFYCIHQYTSNLMISKKIRVRVDTSYAWTHQWQNLQTTTGYGALDSLLATYGFTIQYFVLGQYAWLYTDQEINTYALCDSVETFAGVTEAITITGGIGGGDFIYYTTSGTVRKYYFTLGYGDCPSGCTSSCTWMYNVYPDCSVEFVSFTVFGIDPMPYPLYCNLTNSVKNHESFQKDIELYPNPVKDKLTIKLSDNLFSQLEIYDLQKRILYRKNFVNYVSIDVSWLVKGTYILKIRNNNKTSALKIIKE